jgi:UDP-GlcNAc:undecaprenyl-phosphate/decaprenyl-phosphate GlcNAc-1-phosphate transferase
MYSLLFLGIVSCFLSLLLTPVVRNASLRLGLVDQPDQARKFHIAPVPRLGGVAIFIAVILSYLLLLAVRLSSGTIVWEGLPLFLRLTPALAVIFGTGLVDDVVSVHPWKKLIAEVIAAALAWFGGIHISGIAGYNTIGVIGFVGTVLWIVACTNAINLIDGVDGLAAGISLFAALTMLIAASINHNFPLALAVVSLVGALIGFLRYNLNPASIFLGDSGSLTLGFLLGCYAAVWGEKSSTVLGMTAPLLVLAVPLLDVGLAIVRRFLRGQPIFVADRDHIHHRLLSRGYAPQHVVLLIYGICSIGATISLMLTFYHETYRGFVIVLVVLAAWLGLQHLGYSEFGVVGKMLIGGGFRSVLSAQFALDSFEREFREDISIGQCWEILYLNISEFGFSGVDFHLDGEIHRAGVAEGWQARIDFPGHGYINLWRESGTQSRNASAVLFIDSVSRVMHRKLGRLPTVLQEKHG